MHTAFMELVYHCCSKRKKEKERLIWKGKTVKLLPQLSGLNTQLPFLQYLRLHSFRDRLVVLPPNKIVWIIWFNCWITSNLHYIVEYMR